MQVRCQTFRATVWTNLPQYTPWCLPALVNTGLRAPLRGGPSHTLLLNTSLAVGRLVAVYTNDSLKPVMHAQEICTRNLCKFSHKILARVSVNLVQVYSLFHQRNSPARDSNGAVWLAGQLLSILLSLVFGCFHRDGMEQWWNWFLNRFYSEKDVCVRLFGGGLPNCIKYMQVSGTSFLSACRWH